MCGSRRLQSTSLKVNARAVAFSVVLTAILASGMVLPPVASAASPHKVKVVVLGDSNSASSYNWLGHGPNWASRLMKMLKSYNTKYTFFLDNHAVGRQNSLALAANVAGYLKDGADIVIIMIGTNDMSGGSPTSPGKITLAQTEANLRKIITTAKNAKPYHRCPTNTGSPLVILVQPPPAVSRRVFMSGKTSLSGWRPRDRVDCPGNNLLAVALLCGRLAAQTHVPVVRTWSNMHDIGYDGSQVDRKLQEKYLIDGLHINAPLQAKIAEWTNNVIVRRKTF